MRMRIYMHNRLHIHKHVHLQLHTSTMHMCRCVKNIVLTCSRQFAATNESCQQRPQAATADMRIRARDRGGDSTSSMLGIAGDRAGVLKVRGDASVLVVSRRVSLPQAQAQCKGGARRRAALLIGSRIAMPAARTRNQRSRVRPASQCGPLYYVSRRQFT